ncbi:MAG: hypothetical protein BMS9Abin10_0909 [Gammaproteobacteria bacterium]|nr:MAG: hypothetical protein BMS9Abin10_0909 [Gammaproteobacteria bacterium]
MATSRSARRVLLSILLTLLPGTSFALGLGKLTVHSLYGERFNASIDFVSLAEHEVKTLSAAIVDRFDVPNAGIEATPVTRGIKVTLVQGADGRYELKLYSEKPLREPFVEFLLQLDWAGGRIVRQFTAIVDLPPSMYGSEVADATTTSALDVPATPPGPAAVIAAKQAEPAPRPRPTPHPNQIVANKQPAVPAPVAPPSNALARPRSPAAPTPKARNSKIPRDEREDDPQPQTGSSPSPGVSAQARPTTVKKPDTAAPVLTAQQRQLKSEITAWAKAQQQAAQSLPRTTLPRLKPKTSAAPAVAGQRSSVATGAGARPPGPPPTPVSTSFLGNYTSQWLMIGALVAAGLLLVVGGVALLLYLRRGVGPAAGRQDPVPATAPSIAQTMPVAHERRSGRGRRRRFVPVPFERRQGARRFSDQIPDLGGPMQTTKVDTFEETETYLACGRDEHAEKALKEAIAENPDRLALMVKLLSVYYLRQDKEAFEDLANQLYAELDPSRAGARDQSGQLAELQRLVTQDQYPTRAEDPVPHDDTDAATPKEAEPTFSFELLGGEQSEVGKGPDKEEPEPHTQQVRANAGKQAPEPVAPPTRTDDKKDYERDLELLDTVLASVRDDVTEISFEDVPAESSVEDKADAETDDGQETATRGMAVLQVDDFDSIRDAVDQGIEMIEKETASPKSKKMGKRSRKGKRKQKPDSRKAARSQVARQWKDPAAKIDLAKAYIDRGDAEHARTLLNDVLKNWNED